MNNSAPWVRTLVPSARAGARRSCSCPAGPVSAADPLPATDLTLSAPASGKAGLPVPFTATLTDEGGAPVAGARVDLQRPVIRVDHGPAPAPPTPRGEWSWVPPSRWVRPRWRASYAGDADARCRRCHRRSRSPACATRARLSLTGPTRIVDETHHATSSLLWTANGTPVSGTVTVQRKPSAAGSWTVYRRLRTNSDGPVHPRRDGRASTLPGARSAAPTRGGPRTRPRSSASTTFRRSPRWPTPPGHRAGLDAGAVASQWRRANAVITRISDAGLALDGRTQLAPRLPGRPLRAAPAAASTTGASTATATAARWCSAPPWSVGPPRRCATCTTALPDRRMYRVDRFGWSKKLQRRRRLHVHARRQHLGVQLPQRRQQAGGPLPARTRSRRRHQHLGEPLPLGDRAGAELVVGLAQPPEDRLAVELTPRRTDLAVATASGGPTAPATASTSTGAATPPAGSFTG